MKTKFNLLLLASTLIICTSITASAQVATMEPPTPSMNASLVERELASINAPIKSDSDLYNYISNQHTSPLDKLSPNAKQDFINSLTFGTKGLSGFRYDVLENELTPTEIYSILSLFGMQHNTKLLDGAHVRTSLDKAILQQSSPKGKVGATGSDYGAFGLGGTGGDWGGGEGDDGTDYMDYYCASPGTCRIEQNAICTSNC